MSKRYLLIHLLTALFVMLPVRALCQTDDSASLPESEVISFDEKVHDFGDVLISAGPLKWRFNFTNIDKKPIVIHNVISSCGCTTPKWSKAPVKPGEKGYVDITFSNDQGPYPFDKTLTLYVSGVNRPVILRIRGYAHEKMRKLSDRYPEHSGLLGVRTASISLGYVEQGLAKSETFEVANLSSRKASIAASGLPKGMTVSVTPPTVEPQGVAKVKVTVDTRGDSPKRWGKQNYSFALTADGKKSRLQLCATAFIRDNFSQMSQEQVDRGASPVPDRSYFEFGKVAAGKTVDAAFKIKNTGKETLVIHKVEADREGVAFVGKAPVSVKPGAQTTLKFKYDTKGLSGETVAVVTLVTNSPAKPLVNLFLTGSVIKEK